MLPSNSRPLARLVLLSLLLTFIVSRLITILVMLNRMPDIYLHVRDTHVHHLNYGIFLLAGVGAYLLFKPGFTATPPPPAAAVIYGVDVKAVVLTHGHIDHIGMAATLAASGVAVHLHPADTGLAADPRSNKTDRPVLPYLRWPATLFFLLLAGSIRLAARVQPRLERWDLRGRS